ncbi:phage/plasmid primase, P4 family [Kribbella sp. WER1]
MNLTDFLSRFDGEQIEERDGYVVHCPAHSDSKPSLRITVSDAGKVLLKCRAGCETPYVMRALKLTMRDLASMEVPESLSFDPATSQDVPASAEDVAALGADLYRWAQEARHPHGDRARTYAEERFGITEDDFRRLGLGYAPAAEYNEDGEITNGGLPGGPRLVVPFRDKDGVPRGYQARSFQKDARVRWYGPASPEKASWAKLAWFEGASGWDEVMITEGPGDGMTSVAIGYDTILIRGAGLAANESVLNQVAEWVGDRLAVIAGDGDPSGSTFASRLAQALLARGRRAKILPVPDKLDLTDWRERDGDRFLTNVVRAIADTREETSTAAVLRDRDEDRYPLTDLGNARFARDFIEAQGSGVKFSPEAGFFLLRGGVWKTDKLDRTRAYIQESADRIAQIADRLSAEADGVVGSASSKTARRWEKWARHSQSSIGISAAMKELQALPEVAADVNDFDQHTDLVAVSNGVVNLRTGELSPHDPALLLTRRIEIDYDRDARAPRWEAFLDEVFPRHPDLPAFMRRLVGYGITGRTDEQAFAVLWGTGANGKSVFTDTLTEIFRDLTVTTPFSTFEERASGGIPNDLAALKGARLVMAAEGDQGRPMAEAVLKRVTGKDLISARFMRKEFFEFRPTFLLLLATNFKPKFRGQDEGLWRRVKLIPWERYFRPEERDHALSEKLLAERAGILAWAVRGAVEWFRGGLQDPDIIMKATTEYRETSDALAGFLPGVFVKDTGSGRVTGKVLFEAYLQWADEENLPQRERWTRQTFFAALEERGCVKRKGNQGVVFEGIRRARQADMRPDETERAETEPLALSSPETTTPTRGASLDDVL